MEAFLSTVSEPADLMNVSNPAMPYRFDRIFDLKGFGARRLARRRLKLLKKIDAHVQALLADGEKVEYVSWGVEYSFLEFYFMGVWAQLLNRRAIVLTDRRILTLQINARQKVMDLKSQIRYPAIQKLAKGTFGYLGLVLRDKKTVNLSGIPRRDRKAIRARLLAKIEEVRREAPVAGRENLCPRCGVKVTGFPERCRQCAGPFKSGAKAGWLSLLLPGLGDLYLGHRGLAFLEMLGALGAWTVVLAPLVFGGVDAPDLDPTALGGLAAVVFVFVHGTDAWVTRRMGMKGIYAADR